MLEFVDGKLWIKLTSPEPAKGLGNDALAQRFRRIFENVRNYSRRGVGFAKVVQQVDKLHFSSETDVIVLSEIYEDLLKRVAADSAGYAGEFYTQRHIIRTMVQVVQPRTDERVYDPCFGTAGFLGEAADYLRRHNTLSSIQLDALQHRTFFGQELKPLTYLLGSMNMILHGVEGANLELANTLEVHSHNVPEKDKYKVILANPPYGGKMAQELQTNFRVRSGATECLFLQHIMANLAKGGRAGVVVPEGVLFRGGPDQKVRKELLDQFKVHTILSLPAGCFLPYTGVKTNVLFFDRAEDGSGTKSIWYYDLTNDGFELKQTRKPSQGQSIARLPGEMARALKRGKLLDRVGGGHRWRRATTSRPRTRTRWMITSIGLHWSWCSRSRPKRPGLRSYWTSSNPCWSVRNDVPELASRAKSLLFEWGHRLPRGSSTFLATESRLFACRTWGVSAGRCRLLKPKTA